MSDFFKIYSGDYSKDGYESGIEDAKLKKAKNKFRFFKAVHPVNYVWNFNNSYDSFMKNYQKGYLDGQRVNHNIYSSNQQKGVKMGFDNDSYENHLRMLGEVRVNLKSLKRYIQERRDEYKAQINKAKSAGFVTNYVDQLKTKYNKLEQEIDMILSMLDRHDNYLDKQEGNIRRLIEIARQAD